MHTLMEKTAFVFNVMNIFCLLKLHNDILYCNM